MSMKTIKMNLKAIVLSLGLVAMMAPATLNVQINHGLLNDPYNDNSNMNHGLFNQQGNRSGSYELQNQTFEELPLCSGLFILAAAGVGYALRKKKNNKKH